MGSHLFTNSWDQPLIKQEYLREMTKYLMFMNSTGCHAGNREESGSQSTASGTSTWYWSQTWQAQGTSWRRAWKAAKQSGWAWAETGVRTGNQTPSWSVSHCRSGWQPVTAAPPLLGTSSPPTGNLARLSPARISGSKISNLPALFLF